MPTDHRAKLAAIKRFDQLIAYLRDELGWPIARDSFEDVDDLFYDFTADELGIDPRTAAKIESIKRLRPLSPRQPWGIFFVKFEPKKLPVVALRRILSQVALKKRASAHSADRTAWAKDDLLFVSNYGEGDERQISFAHFSTPSDGHDLPTLKVLGWDNRDTALHLDAIARELTEHLAWPENDGDASAWRERWRAAFTLRHREVVTTSRELSIRLAALARDIRDRIKTALAIETDRGPLKKLMKAFQEALVHDLDADGFADMYAQTIAYGLLSARIADPSKKTADDFAAHMRTNPFLKELMETFLHVGGRRGKTGGPGIDFDELGVSEVVELLDDANMDAVVRDFGDRSPQEDPVTHFYELFLNAFDQEAKKRRGVFYTPLPVVSYIVRSVDGLLRTELGLPDGLADTTAFGISRDKTVVHILDPATGTGTFLVEVIDRIYRTLLAKWKGLGRERTEALWNDYVQKDLLPRLRGYELLMAPYAIAHLKVGLKLYETGYRFSSDERARVYLTNALEPPVDPPRGLFQESAALAREAVAAKEVKEEKGWTVVIGNPPYKNNSDYTLAQIADRFPALLKTSRDAAAAQVRNIRDDYAWFFSAADSFTQGGGAICLVTSDSYLKKMSYRYFRRELIRSYRIVRVTRLGGGIFVNVGPRIGFAIVTMIRRNERLRDPEETEPLELVDISNLAESMPQRDHGSPRDPRLQWLAKAGDHDAEVLNAAGVRGVVVRPTEESDYRLVGDSADGQAREMRTQIVAKSDSRFTSLFRRKWPGIITAFDSLLKAESDDILAKRMRRFFAVSEGNRASEIEALAEECRCDDEQRARLAYLCKEAKNTGLRFEKKCIKPVFAGSIPDGNEWYPPLAYAHWIYYEPRIKIPRNVNSGKHAGWGWMQQWREPQTHEVFPKLIFTTSTNRNYGFRAYVVSSGWYTKLHGAASQQYHYVTLTDPMQPERLEGGHNNLAAGGEALFSLLKRWGLKDEDLLHFIGAFYNSFHARSYGGREEESMLPLPTVRSEDESLVKAIVSSARRLRELRAVQESRGSRGGKPFPTLLLSKAALTLTGPSLLAAVAEEQIRIDGLIGEFLRTVDEDADG